MSGLAKRIKPSQLQKKVRNMLSKADAETFSRLFGFTGDDEQPWEAYRHSIRHFMSVMMFQFPNMRIAETFKVSTGGDAFLYHFEEPSPFPGPT